MRYIENNTASPMYVGGRLIPPFDGRHFEDSELPGNLRVAAAPAPAEPAPSIDEELHKLLEHGVNKIVPELPSLTQEALERIEHLEHAGKKRSTLIAAIQAERLDRANRQMQAEEEQQRAAQLQAAEGELLTARVALENLPPTASPEERKAAEDAAADAQAKVDALKAAEGEDEE